MAYEWKTGFFKTDANVAGEVFTKLEQSGGLTAKRLVDASRDEAAPLHNEFEWDDEVAGELWREQQARVMICNLTVTVEDKNKESVAVRAFVTVSPDTETYESIETVLRSEDKSTAMLRTAMKELVAFERKYATLEALAGVFREIHKIKEV